MDQFSRLRKTAIATAAAQAITLSVCSLSQAAIIVVNEEKELTQGCDLREAVAAINSGADNANCEFDTTTDPIGTNDTIVFDNSVEDISLSDGEILIESDVSINPQGHDIRISSDNQSRAFSINAATVSIENASISENSSSSGAGAISIQMGTLTLEGCELIENTARARGGAVYVYRSTATFRNTHISENKSQSDGGAIRGRFSTINIENSRVENNRIDSAIGDGGAISVDAVTLNITSSTVSGNTTGTGIGDGGGIYASGGNSGGSTVTIKNSLIAGNSAAFEGGGIKNFRSRMFISNSTISGNETFRNGRGGGIQTERGDLYLNSSTISDNESTQGGGIYIDLSSVTVTNSIIVGNRAGRTAEFDGNFASLGTNLLGHRGLTLRAAFGFGFQPASNDIIATSDGTNPASTNSILAPLADNGGDTLTHALVNRSLAVDAADSTLCASEPINNLDQRMQPRPVGEQCDIGAFEGELDPETSFFVVPLANGNSVIFEL